MNITKKLAVFVVAALSGASLAAPAHAITIDSNRFFAYVYQPNNRFHIMLSYSPCPVSKNYFGYAEQVPPNGGKPWPSCWRTAEDNKNVVAICPIVEGKISYCQFVSKEYFKDTSTLPAAAFK